MYKSFQIKFLKMTGKYYIVNSVKTGVVIVVIGLSILNNYIYYIYFKLL